MFIFNYLLIYLPDYSSTLVSCRKRNQSRRSSLRSIASWLIRRVLRKMPVYSRECSSCGPMNSSKKGLKNISISRTSQISRKTNNLSTPTRDSQKSITAGSPIILRKSSHHSKKVLGLFSSSQVFWQLSPTCCNFPDQS